MNSEQVANRLLVNELQLGSQLNVAVANGTRNKFNLLLSFLSGDARDFSQFALPRSTLASLSTQEIRESFSLSEPQPLVNKGISLKQAEKVSVAIHRKKLTEVRLQYLLNNEAVLSRYKEELFDPDIVDNLSFVAQRRLKNAQKDTQKKEDSPGIDYQLIKEYQALDIDNKPVKLTYM